MLSNTTTSYKLKASKSSRDLNNYHFNHNDDKYETDSLDDGPAGDSSRRQLIYTSRDGRYKSTRSRQTEFRHGRMGPPSDRRGYNRGRGGPTSRRERDFSDANNFSQGRKYHDTLNRTSEPGGMFYRSKCYEPEKKSEIKFNLPEDTRISKLLRRLSMEMDQDNSLTISKKLLEVLLIPENAHYVRKAFHILGDSMLDILYTAPGIIAKKEAAKALGRMGYIMGQENDFARFQDWMFSRMSNASDDIRYLFMKALKETLEFETKKRVLQDHSVNLIQDLVALIEVLENASLFKCTLDVLITLVEIYPEDFYTQFRDAIDIFLGWHVDLLQPLSNIEFISKSLQRIKGHFQNNLEFSRTLVYHFFEDIDTTAKEFEKDKDYKTNSINNLTIYILSLNTILKCLDGSLKPASNELVSAKFVTDYMIQIINTVSNALLTCVPDNLIIAVNENITLLLTILPTKSNTLNNAIYTLISLEISLINQFTDSTTISMLLMISKILKELSANLPSDLVQKLVGPQSKIINLRYSTFVEVQEATICVYQALLNLKNIPLLQEAYRCVLGNLEVVYKEIVPTVQPLCQNNPFEDSNYVCKDMELSALFLLRCLSQLANASGSIIGMWALKPSMLELLGVLLEPYNQELRTKAPFLQYSVFFLLYSHCKCYNHFIASSSLISNKQENGNLMGLCSLNDGLIISDIPSKSPNSENFALILNLLYNALNVPTSCKITHLLLQWINDILVLSESYLTLLYNSSEFNQVANVLVKCGYNCDVQIVLAVSANLTKLLNKKELSWSNSFLVAINELCIFHMNSNNKDVRHSYTALSENIPWDLTIVQFNKVYSFEEAKQKCQDLQTYNNYTIVLAQHLHLSGTIYGELLPLHFMTFMKYLLNGEELMPNWLEDIFMCCWPLESDVQVDAKNIEAFRNLALTSRAVLNNWITFEAAQLCVNLKLRTPLGKPNETFTSFEGLLKQLAKDVLKSKPDSTDENCARIDHRRVRMLLQFMEHLEKAIYNASEGCAIAMPPASKPVRTFFHTNSTTCKEWLARIRIIMVYVALHAGQSTIALRNGQELLKNLVKNDKTQTVEFERAVMFVTLALLNLREHEAIYGLYTWCKKVANKKFDWLKYASEQANKRYECAAQNFKSILEKKEEHSEEMVNEDNNQVKETDGQVKQFMSNQIINCYKELNSWNDILGWQNEKLDLGYTENGVKFSFVTVNNKYVQALSDIEILNSVNKLNNWAEEESTNRLWSTYDMIRNTEDSLYDIALNINRLDDDVLLSKLAKSSLIIQEGIQDNLLTLPSEFLQNFLLNHYIVNGLKTALNHSLPSNVFLVSENFENDIQKIDSTILSKILWWSEYFSRDNLNLGFNSFSNSLRIHVIRKARKERNYNLATFHINKFLSQEELFKIETKNQHHTITHIGNILLKNSGKLSTCSIDFAKVVKESIKLLYATDENKELVFNLCASASKAIYKNAEVFCNQHMRQLSSKILLKLSTWLLNNENVISLTEIGSPLVTLLMVLPEIGMIENLGNNVIPPNELAIGKLLQFSVHQCITLAKNWFAFGTWCYRWGRKIINHNCDVTTTLTDEDKIAVHECLPLNVTESDFMQVLTVLSMNSGSNDDDINTNEINRSEIVREELKNILSVYRFSEEQLELLVQIWKKCQKRIYSYYELSADAYFRYLHLVTNSENINKSAECNTITATLRLLHLIVKYALELQTVLDNGLASTPTQPWKVIIPQLFSHLNHPEAYVRQRVSEFLCRVANDAPHLITFPAVVGAVEGGVKFDFSEMSMPKDCFSQCNSNEDDTELTDDIEDTYESDIEEPNHSVLQLCFKSMVETLSKLAPETITQVQLLVKELRRITLLWDELWLGTLIQYHTEMIQRQHQLEMEVDKVNENPNLEAEEKASLISEKYRIIMKPIIFILEQLQSITSSDPETPHEKQFQERYAETIKEVLEKLKNPDHPEKSLESWQPLKLLQSKFQQRAHKRAAYTLKMQDISPILANLKDTVIAMPGLTMSSKPPITISSVSNHVSILPTKTKPKKLIFHGSDGQTYTYLFKGLEDLHLDERIMQFLSIANTMMAQGSDGSAHNLYRARHYSVIPLGPRSGLINWVDGTTSVFALYKRWQQRDAAKASTKTNNGQKGVSNTNIVLRPSELFYNKLNPLLTEHGVKNPENRKEWPLAVLKQVLTDLMNETPNDLLAKELWCHSINAGEWWQIVRNYSYSIAVMSTLGYIIGLGDRHLDNVLVDLSSGVVVHIDYNVCFDKGKTLRVPEKVPFRLTPNIVEALGVTGVEGIFRLACENVLKTMKKGRETLLTLLEAFVYDPLVDWTVGGEGLAGTAFRGVTGNSVTRQSRKDLEKEVTLSMYSVRCTEMKIDFIINRDDILVELPVGIEKLQKWLNAYRKMLAIEDLLQDLHQQMTLVKEAEANGVDKHALYSLPIRYEAYKKRQDTISTAMKDLELFISETDLHRKAYSEAIKVLDSPQYSQWIMEVNVSMEQKNCHIFDLVKEFLQMAKSSLIAHCEQSENDVEHYRQQQTLVTTKCLHLLQEYSTLYTQFPPTYREKHRTIYYSNWSKKLLENKNITTWEAIYNQLCSFRESFKLSTPPKAILDLAYQLNVELGRVSTTATKSFEELSTIDEANKHVENIYSSAKLALSSFLRCEKDGFKALKYIILNELCKLNRDYLNCEATVSRSRNYILLMSVQKGGDWFLDDLTWYSNNALEFIRYLISQETSYIEDPMFIQSLNVVQAVNNVYKSLQELYYNFHTIILPESMKKIMHEEPSVIQVISELNALVVNVGMPLPDLVTQLEKQLTCIVMEMEVDASHVYILEMLTKLKASYHVMLQTQSETLSQGKMLLMGFNGLFDKLNVEFKNLINTLTVLEIPLCWRKVDQVKQARNLAAPIFNSQVKSILDDIFLLKRLQTMSDFFNLSFEMTDWFKVPVSIPVYCDDQLDKPIKKFIADFVIRQFLGISTEAVAYTVCILLQSLGLNVTSEIEQKDIGAENKVSLDDLNKKAGNLFLKQGVFTQNVLAQASNLQSNLKSSWNVIQELKQKKQSVALIDSRLIKLQNQVTTYSWLHENVLYSHSGLGTNTARSKFVANLQAETSNLNVLIGKMAEVREQQKTLITDVNSRLNWAVGANPDVNPVMSAFDSAVVARENRLDLENQIANLVFNTCNGILQHELLRTQSTESDAIDKRFLGILKKWQNILNFSTVQQLEEVTSTEENIMRLYTQEMINNPMWVLLISEKISAAISNTQKKLSDIKENLFILNDSIHIWIEKLKTLYTKHGKLMSEVKTLIKAMVKIEDCSTNVQEFMLKYRQYSENFMPILTCFKKEITNDEVTEIINNLKYLNENTEIIYDSLVSLDKKNVKNETNKPPLVRQEGISLSPTKISPLKQDGTTKVQQRNAYAMGVWRRVRLKLEGRDPDPAKKYTNHEQVDYIIREASSLDNLALMYEGWTPWV